MIDSPIENLIASITYTRSVYGVSAEAAQYCRRRGFAKVIEPTEADWAQYRGALAAAEVLDKIADNQHINIGPIEIDEPEARRKPGDYIETEDEWIERVAELIAASGGSLPDDLDRALSAEDAATLRSALGQTGAQITGRAGWTRNPGYSA